MPHLLSTSHIQCIVKQFIIKLMYQNFSLLESGNFRDLTHAPMSMECFIHVKDDFEKKNLVLPIEKFLSLLLPKNARELQQHLKALLSNACLPEVKKIKNFKLLPLKVITAAFERWLLTFKSFQI